MAPLPVVAAAEDAERLVVLLVEPHAVLLAVPLVVPLAVLPQEEAAELLVEVAVPIVVVAADAAAELLPSNRTHISSQRDCYSCFLVCRYDLRA